MITNHTMPVDKAQKPKVLSEHTKLMDLDSVRV